MSAIHLQQQIRGQKSWVSFIQVQASKLCHLMLDFFFIDPLFDIQHTASTLNHEKKKDFSIALVALACHPLKLSWQYSCVTNFQLL